MKHIPIFLFCAALAAQSVPPGGGKPVQVGVNDANYSASPRLNVVSGSGVSLSKSSAGGTTTLTINAAGAGLGDMSSSASVSVDGEAVVYDGITGKLAKRFAGSGIGIFSNGVLSTSASLQWNATTGLGLIKPLTLGQLTNEIGTLHMWGTSSKFTLQPAAATTEWTWTWPTSGGTNGYCLTTNGSGVTSWASCAGGSMVYPGAGIAVSTGSAWTTSLTAPTGALVGAGQANTFTTGAQDFGSATSLKVPTSAGAAPTASGLIAYDSTANQFKGGVNAANRIFLTSDSSGNTTLPGTLTVPGTGASNFTAIASPAGTPVAGTGDFYLDSTTKRLATKDDAGTVVNYVGATGNIATATALAANGANCTGQVALGVNASGACEGTATPTLGTAGSVVGTLAFANATSGNITLYPVTGALGTIAITLPAAAGTAVVASTSTTTTQALFATATAGAPAFRALAATDLPAASDTAVGGVELATTAETTTGTDTGRAVTPAGLAASTFGKRVFMVEVIADDTAITTGDGKYYLPVPSELDGYNIVSVSAHVGSAISSSGAITVDLARCAAVATGIRCSGTVADILSTNLTVDANEDGSETAATAAVIDTANDDLPSGGHIRIDVDGAGTGTKGLIIKVTVQKT
jgi:hypothetical protein